MNFSKTMFSILKALFNIKIHDIKNNTYPPFNMDRFIMGFIVNLPSLLYVWYLAIVSSAYMSTSISAVKSNPLPSEVQVENNLKRASDRAKDNGNVLNPAGFQCSMEVWSGHEYLMFWRITLKIMKIAGKGFISYRSDLATSKGCNNEVEYANKIGMRIIYK